MLQLRPGPAAPAADKSSGWRMLLLQPGQQQRSLGGGRASSLSVVKAASGSARAGAWGSAGGGGCERRRAAAALRAASLTVKEVSRQVKPYFGIAQNSNIGEMSSCALQRAGFELCGLG